MINASEAILYYYENHPTAGPIPSNFRFYARDGAFVKRHYDRGLQDWIKELSDAWEKGNVHALHDIPSFIKALPTIRSNGAGKLNDDMYEKNQKMLSELLSILSVDKGITKKDDWVKENGRWIKQ